MVGEQLVFNTGDDKQCYTVNIVNDDDCEQPAENFLSDLSYVSGQQVVTIDPNRTTVVIDDDTEPECGTITDCGYQFFTLHLWPICILICACTTQAISLSMLCIIFFFIQS